MTRTQDVRQGLTEAAAKAFRKFFDPDWYLDRYPDVRNYIGRPEDHYLQCGQTEGRTPHWLIDPNWYLDHHPDIAQTGHELLSHYLMSGWRQLHSPHPLFDPKWYLLQNLDLVATDIDPIDHYLDHGWREGRTLHPLFDTAWYLSAYRDIAIAGIEPLGHFLTHGWQEGRRPHPLFDTAWYLDRYRDVAEGGQNPWLHYIRQGWREGRMPHPRFDAGWYSRTYLVGVEKEQEPLAHYLSDGWREGLLPSPSASVRSGQAGPHAPLYQSVIEELAGRLPATLEKRRGTILFVTHETEVGGAPHVLRQFATWMRDRTRFEVRIVAIRGGNLRQAFSEVAPLLVLSDHPEEMRSQVLKDWMGDNVCGAFVNSVASGSFLRHAPESLPTVAFIHELPQILDMFPDEVDLIRQRARRVIGGGPEVTRALGTDYGYPPESLASAVSFIESLPADSDPAQRRAAARTTLNLPPERLVVMGCGLLHWRKAPDKFIETAALLRAKGIDAEFVWLGGGPDLEICQQMVAQQGLEDRVRFTGYEPDVAGKLAAADIFLLSSQEDPFPLVALYAAQAAMPIVCFQGAGGIEGFVAHGSGLSVPYMNVEAMAEAVAVYIADPERRRAEGARGQAQVMRSHTIEVVGPVLLHHLREAMGLAPEVSVVVPNYNYAQYLPERLASISAQIFQDFEVILLDDASPDDSVALLSDFAKQRPDTQVVVNKINSGSPFAQWMRGMDLSRSNLIWLAEADDRCTPDFLQTMLPFFNDRNMRIASCASRPVTSDGQSIGDYRLLYLDRITPGRWDRDYVATDHEEAQAGLGIANSIPNASAVLFRKFNPEPEFAAELAQMRLCGDWYFYCRAMRGGLVGFSSVLMNDHRRHGNTVTHRLEGSMDYFNELSTVRNYLGRTYRQDIATQTRIAQFLAQDIARFEVSESQSVRQPAHPSKLMPSLLIVAPDLGPGGGQVFAISIANEWAQRGGRVVLLNVGNQPSHPAMLARISPEVMLIEAQDPQADLATLIARFDIDVVHSSIWWADRWVDDQRHGLPPGMPWIITMHGCHETILDDPDTDPSFAQRMERMTARADWVYTAEKNLQVFDRLPRPKRLTHIANGMPRAMDAPAPDRAALGLRPEALILGLATRAIDSKGWHQAVRLTQKLNMAGYTADLLLIGEGPAADSIRKEAPPHVFQLGQVNNLQAYLGLLDIGLLPSYFRGESLPLVLIDMMAQGVPIIASEIGEIPWMLTGGENPAGLLVPLTDDGIDEHMLLSHAIALTDPGLRSKLRQGAISRFNSEFEIGLMLSRYMRLYGGATL
uniref:Glycosyl transferase n=1 Tax=Paracoccus yeei TaxID=147645 RepID=A0A0D5A1B9_9RHOB|nr:glycosyltransferase [Paracoccus yeei]AJW30080.1 glycosyl transferase [Paracoccus yeei]